MNTLTQVVLGLFLLIFGTVIGRSTVDPVVETVVDTVGIAQMQRIIDESRIETEGLRARLEGVRNLPPQVVYVTDTAYVEVPDTVFQFVTVRSGQVTVGSLVSQDASSLRVPQVATTRFSNCDDGLEVNSTGNGVICDPAVLGHLYVVPTLSNRSTIGIEWEPHYRSPFKFQIAHDGEVFLFGLRYRFQIF